MGQLLNWKQRRLLTGGAAAVCLMLWAWMPALCDKGTPPLPRALDDAKNRPTLLEFYAEWCGTCRKFKPFVQQLEKQYRNDLHVKVLDFDDPDNLTYVKQYRITGTPTFVLFDAKGAPMFRTERVLSQQIIETQVMRALGKLKKVKFPDQIKGLTSVRQSQPLLMVSFSAPGCGSCEPWERYLDFSENLYKDKIRMVRLKSDEPGVGALMKDLDVTVFPTFVLMDRQGHELYRMVQPYHPPSFVNMLGMFAEGTLQ